MAKERLSNFQIPNDAIVVVSRQGNIIRIHYLSRRNRNANMIKIDNDTYMVVSTGEIKNFTHFEHRTDDLQNLRGTFGNLRGLINTNCTNPYRCKWITLTYRQDSGEPMTDTKILRDDVGMFIKDLRRMCAKLKYGRPEYIIVCEPQGNGAWHCHVILIFPEKAPFLACSDDTFRMLNIERKKGERTIEELWKRGFCSVKNFKSVSGNDVDNVGAYVTAYVADLPLEEAVHVDNLNLSDYELKGCECLDENGKKVTKRFVKGARLKLYPANFHPYRYSRGIVKPLEYETTWGEIKKEVSGQTLTYSLDNEIKIDIGSEKTLQFISSIREFNSKRKSSQAIFNNDLVDIETGVVLEQDFLLEQVI